MCGFGIPQEDIATFLEIDLKTLYKYYRRELDTAVTEVNSRVAGTLFQQIQAGSTAGAIFWLKVRGKGQWSEKNASLSVDTKDGKTVINVNTGVEREPED